ncbi:SDR family oxidoreductase [Mesobacillus subterraneus]|uniref:SDR family oxidoreductase n=1 Tax=Mesobacillus subterraneus TaxID=285983 RepID=UPI00204074A5|nr:SDR family oxidoreductase [Mesobacillus subterraneus]MCM3666241.1 SDR family oxidoreductase [Mesobacillus subterraneus]MCM3685240.1 SDR family oxidoreductase [Mesobacillus subterraneus]
MSAIKNKIVIITGASSGIGRATAMKLANEGAKIVLAARREELMQQLAEEIQSLGGTTVYKVTDVTSLEQVQSLTDFALEQFGQIDVLFNNAGIMPLSYMKNNRVGEWDQMIDVNIKGVLHGVSAVLPHMLERNSGHIITTSSVAGHGIFPSGTVYCATKFAARVIMEGLNKELTKSNIRTTTISPGVVDTELVDLIVDPEVRPIFENPELPSIKSEDIANAVFYALSQPATVAVNEIIIRPTNQG